VPKLEEFSLRQLRQQDLSRVLDWRNSDRIRASVFNDTVISLEEHRAWFKRIQNSSEIVVLIFEHRAVPMGIISFTQIDPKNGKALWGFYVGEKDRPSGMGSALGYLGIRYGFEDLRLRKVTSEVLCSNARSVGLHQKLGFVQEGHFRAAVLKNGIHEDVLSFALFADDWRRDQGRLFQLIFCDKTQSSS
jgi:UDP-4-amino-4,6-dideoxy-N-acetyl-beta-L-altrosamine N-acetyltransferase